MKTPIQIRERMESLRSIRANWETRYQSISDHQLARADFTSKHNNNAPRDAKIYDNTAMDAWTLLTNAIQSILANVDTKWLYLETLYEEELSDEELLWLDDATDELLNMFRDSEARFPTQFNETIGDLTGYGTASIHSMYNPATRSMFFSSRPLNEIYIDQDDRGVIDVTYREFRLTPRQAMLKWPRMPMDVEDRLKRMDPSEKTLWIQTFEPHDEKPQKVQSQVIMETEGSVVQEEELDELPIHSGRWRTDPGQVYGTGPGVTADAFARTLNSVIKEWITAVQKSVRPPLLVADDGVIGVPSTMPGTITKISAYSPGNQDPVRPMDTGGNFQVGNEEILRLQTSIRRAYLHEILQITDSKELTAFHVQELTSRSQQWVAPVFQRISVEIIQPMVKRALSQSIKFGRIPRPPDSLIEKGFRVVYISPAQRASEIQETEATMRSVERAVAMGQVWPDVLDNFDPDVIARTSHLGFSADPKVLRPLKTVREMRRLREQRQAQEQAQLQAQEAGAVAAAAGGDANVAKILSDISGRRR